MSRGRRIRGPSLAEEKKNRDKLYPDNLSWRDKLCYRVVHWLALLQAFILSRLVQEPVWRSGTGRVQRIRDLDSRHLDNIVRLVRREARSVDEELKKALFAEQARRYKSAREDFYD